VACAPVRPPPEPAPQPAVIEVPPEQRPCYRIVFLEVRKSERTLRVDCEDGGMRSFPVSLSRDNRGAKRRRGDLRMPEGDYRISGPARASRFHLFLPFDYPSPADAEHGLASGTITSAERTAIEAAWERGAMPPQNTRLGGVLGLHGEGARWRGSADKGLDWTEGCVALRDDDITYVAARTAPGTPIRILP
jgi:murein L,D-transpeptidase YafK